MTELQKITTEVKPTSMVQPVEETPEYRYEEALRNLVKSLKVTGDKYRAFDEGVFSEKNKVSSFSKILIDVLIMIFDQDDTTISNPAELVIHKQNKKFIKEALVMLLSNVKNYNVDEEKAKLLLIGKLIQSLYESKS